MGEPKTLMEVFEAEGWLDDELDAGGGKPIGDPEAMPTQEFNLLILDDTTTATLARYAREGGITKAEVLTTALKLYGNERRKS